MELVRLSTPSVARWGTYSAAIVPTLGNGHMKDWLRTLLTLGVTTSDLSHKAESEHILQQLVKTSETLLYTNADSELAPAEEQLLHDALATIDTEFDPLD